MLKVVVESLVVGQTPPYTFSVTRVSFSTFQLNLWFELLNLKLCTYLGNNLIYLDPHFMRCVIDIKDTSSYSPEVNFF
jgi:hypothetical protein